MKKVE